MAVKNKSVENIKSRSLAEETWRRLLKNKGAVFGMCFLILLVVVALLSGFIYDYDTQIIQMNMKEALQPPSAAHWFGTDSLGRDIFARVLYGARYSLLIGVGSVTIGLIVGLTLGGLLRRRCGSDHHALCRRILFHP